MDFYVDYSAQIITNNDLTGDVRDTIHQKEYIKVAYNSSWDSINDILI